MIVQTILTVIAWVFSVIAISVALGASKQAGETKSLVWRLNKEDHESRLRENLHQDRLSRRVYALEERVVDLEKKTDSKTEEKCCATNRPRSYVTLGEGEGKIFVLLPERKKELCKEASKPHKVDEYCVGCTNLIALGGTKPACALDRKCEGYDKKGE